MPRQSTARRRASPTRLPEEKLSGPCFLKPFSASHARTCRRQPQHPVAKRADRAARMLDIGFPAARRVQEGDLDGYDLRGWMPERPQSCREGRSSASRGRSGTTASSGLSRVDPEEDRAGPGRRPQACLADLPMRAKADVHSRRWSWASVDCRGRRGVSGAGRWATASAARQELPLTRIQRSSGPPRLYRRR
jgi:hypothetical protein